MSWPVVAASSVARRMSPRLHVSLPADSRRMPPKFDSSGGLATIESPNITMLPGSADSAAGTAAAGKAERTVAASAANPASAAVVLAAVDLPAAVAVKTRMIRVPPNAPGRIRRREGELHKLRDPATHRKPRSRMGGGRRARRAVAKQPALDLRNARRYAEPSCRARKPHPVRRARQGADLVSTPYSEPGEACRCRLETTASVAATN